MLQFFFSHLCSDEKTHASYKKSLEDLCLGVKPSVELPEITEAMTLYKRLHGKAEKRKQEAGSRWEHCGNTFLIK